MGAAVPGLATAGAVGADWTLDGGAEGPLTDGETVGAVDCTRRIRPGASGFAGATGCGFGVVAALFATEGGSEGARTAAALRAATPVAILRADDGAVVVVPGAALPALLTCDTAIAGATV